MSEVNIILQDFVLEAKEYLKEIEVSVKELKDKGRVFDASIVNKISKAIRSISGAAGYHNLNNVKVLAQCWEKAFNKIHSKQRSITIKNIAIIMKPVRKLKTAFKDPQNLMNIDFVEEMVLLEEFGKVNCKNSAVTLSQKAVEQQDIISSQNHNNNNSITAYMIVSNRHGEYFSFSLNSIDSVMRIRKTEIEEQDFCFIDEITSYDNVCDRAYGIVFIGADGIKKTLIVNNIIDICYWNGVVDIKNGFSGVVGSAHISEYATTVVDISMACAETVSAC